MTFDPLERTIKASLDFSDSDHKYMGDNKQDYTMKFSRDYNSIESGELVRYDSEGKERGKLEFGLDKQLRYVRYDKDEGPCIKDQ